jgi:hypothetical protein
MLGKEPPTHDTQGLVHIGSDDCGVIMVRLLAISYPGAETGYLIRLVPGTDD